MSDTEMRYDQSHYFTVLESTYEPFVAKASQGIVALAHSSIRFLSHVALINPNGVGYTKVCSSHAGTMLKAVRDAFRAEGFDIRFEKAAEDRRLTIGCSQLRLIDLVVDPERVYTLPILRPFDSSATAESLVDELNRSLESFDQKNDSPCGGEGLFYGRLLVPTDLLETDGDAKNLFRPTNAVVFFQHAAEMYARYHLYAYDPDLSNAQLTEVFDALVRRPRACCDE